MKLKDVLSRRWWPVRSCPALDAELFYWISDRNGDRYSVVKDELDHFVIVIRKQIPIQFFRVGEKIR